MVRGIIFELGSFDVQVIKVSVQFRLRQVEETGAGVAEVMHQQHRAGLMSTVLGSGEAPQ